MNLGISRLRKLPNGFYEDISDETYTSYAACHAIQRIERSRRYLHLTQSAEWERIRRSIPRLFWETRESVREGCNDVVAIKRIGDLEVHCTFLASEEWEINIYRKLV